MARGWDYFIYTSNLEFFTKISTVFVRNEFRAEMHEYDTPILMKNNIRRRQAPVKRLRRLYTIE